MKYKGVYQRNTKDCGVACLLSIIKHYKGSNTFENIRHLTKCGNNGITALNLIEASKKLGFEAKGLKCNYEDLNKLQMPLICHTVLENGYNHYIVIHKTTEKSVIVFDPYSGVKNYSKQEFLKIWSGIVIELKPKRKMEYIKEKWFHHFKDLIKDNKISYLKISLFSFISIILTLITNYYFKALIDFNNLFQIFIFFLVITIIKEINDLYRNSTLIKIDNKILTELNLKTHEKLLSLPYYYFNSRTRGDIITKFNDLEYIKTFLVKFPICLFIDSILIIFTSIILFNISSKLFIIFIIVCLFYLLTLVCSNDKVKKLIELNQECNSMKNTVLLENINCINTIKNMNIKDLRDNLFSKIHNTFIDSNINYEKFYNIMNFFKNIILFVGINVVLYVGMILVNRNEMSLSDLILFNSLIIYFIEPLKEIHELSPIIKNGINAIKRVSEIYSIDTRKNYICEPSNYNILFNNLNFSYNGYNNVLQDINYSIEFKDKVMVVGESGCGKSTLFKLLSKIYEVDNDNIRLGSSDINDINVDNIITYVSEEEKLFNDTIYNNITLDSSSEINDEILNITGIMDILIRKNLNLNSIIDEDGTNLSKGEKQKIILSRVLFKNSKIIVLDESLSGVEECEEYEIMRKILSKLKDVTVIYISHSKVCLNLFDKVLNFNQKEDL